MDVLTYATIKVLTDGQAYVHALIHAGADAPEAEFQAAMNDYKKDHAELIEEVIAEIMEQYNLSEEEE